MTIETKQRPPRFDAAFKAQFAELVRWRRDVRRFRSDPVQADLVARLLALAACAPSVGLSQPWRFVLVETPARRQAIAENFAGANHAALDGYAGEQQARYAKLKLEGLAQAPVHLAVCADETTAAGHGLDARPCRRRSDIRWSQPFRRCGSPPAPRDWASAGSQSSILRPLVRPSTFRPIGASSPISASAGRKRNMTIRS